MKIKTLQRKIKKLYPSVVVDTKDGCVHLTGTLDSQDDIVNAGYMSVDKKRYLGVLNDIKLKGFEEPKIRIPKTKDTTLDGLRVDCLVIGGGISGTSILRELTRYNISALLVEKESDLAMQASGRNDGEVHPGVDLNKGNKNNIMSFVLTLNLEIFVKNWMLILLDVDNMLVSINQLIHY